MLILDQIAKLDNVLILGFAREGQSTYRFLRQKFPNLRIGLADQKHPDNVPNDPLIETFFGQKYLHCLKNDRYKLVIKSPGISPHLSEIVKSKKTNTIFTSHMQLFFENCPSHNIVGVTGTKGKSTTSSLISHVLSQNNIPSLLVGNIGTPALDFLPQIAPDTWVICELSSYQLMDLKFSPHIAVLQNIFPDHLDYHKSMREYVNAKRNLIKHQTHDDYFIYNADNSLSAASAKLTSAHKIPLHLPSPQIPSQLPGLHNQYNILPSLIIGQLLNLNQSQILSSIQTFKPLATRLENCGVKNNITFYADTLATIPEATIAAIDTLNPTTLIAGGFDRHQKYALLAKKIVDAGIQTLILFPSTGPRIAETVADAQKLSPDKKLPQIFHVSSMQEAINLSFTHTPAEKICLLSPAAPSFTLFKDYRDEANQYQNAIKNH